MAKQKTRFKSLNIYIVDQLETIVFYQDLGFFIVTSSSEFDDDATHMMLSEKSDFMLSIRDASLNKYDGCVSIMLNNEIKVPCTEQCEVDVKKQAFLISIP